MGIFLIIQMIRACVDMMVGTGILMGATLYKLFQFITVTYQDGNLILRGLSAFVSWLFLLNWQIKTAKPHMMKSKQPSMSGLAKIKMLDLV
jgi:Na+-transporting NADH:ubiquinone oxidoreductase subunit NqrD